MANDPYKGTPPMQSPLVKDKLEDLMNPGRDGLPEPERTIDLQVASRITGEPRGDCAGCGTNLPLRAMTETPLGHLCNWLCIGGNKHPEPEVTFDPSAHAKHIRALVADLNEAIGIAHQHEIFVVVRLDEPCVVNNHPARLIAVVGGIL